MIDIFNSRLPVVAIPAALLLLVAPAVVGKAFYPKPAELQKIEQPPSLDVQKLNQALREIQLDRFTLTVSPDTLRLDGTAEVVLVVRPRRPLHEAIPQPQTAATTTTPTVREVLLARLDGFGVEIKSLSSEEQAVRVQGDTTWRWAIKATDKGTHKLTTTLTALVTINGVERKQDIRTLDASVNVRVTLGDRVAGFLAGNWQWLWAAILIPAAGWLVQQRKSRRRAREID